MYPPTSKYAHRGPGNFNGNAPLPTFPTMSPPGSAEKVSVLAERARMHQNLWHPCDVSEANVEITPVLVLQAG